MAGTRDFLFELGVEEMPSAPLNNAVKQLKTLISKGLDDAGLAHGDVRIISSPRRLAALVLDVAEATEEIHSVLRGPSAKIAFDAEGNPTKAAEGFARKNGMTAAELVRREDADGTEYVFAEQNTPSEPAVSILTACARISSLPFSGLTTVASGGGASMPRSCVRCVGSAACSERRSYPSPLPT